jgi:hypothetical protein
MQKNSKPGTQKIIRNLTIKSGFVKEKWLFLKKMNIFSSGQFFSQFGNSPAPTHTLRLDSFVGLADGNRPVVVAFRITLDDTAGDKHRFDYADNCGFVAAADICRACESRSYLAVKFTVKTHNIIE